ncbi:TetR/AcrR family transcriptional regulator [Photobacterium aphoticum]|uniref:TetR family transcriptional regulator n=1 Tax=Photobacterium aphoticum TaxID=754436 RepID=A0A0J1GL19_9GAMM|nr:TetR/AcrR family transcriptional regulator [Photobacterium aphoticum]KLV00398.1 TetR family transcriptional regulator [Photobacterium aphoticum]PSU59738.1 TetR/AcrR family transcriptional regulator [Photobacterium aphoticum]GHA42779.1 TetR family transcriptional regulator [Photobacterium aphoticum]
MLTPRSAQKREQILQAATALFVEQGYGISMEAIAAKAQVSKQTVYAHFKTKDELFDTCIRACCSDNQLDISLMDDPRSPEQVLCDFAWRFQSMLLTDEAKNTYKTAVRQSESHPELAAVYLHAGPEYTTHMVAAYLTHLVEKGVLVSHLNCQHAALQLLMMFHGRSVYWAYLGQEGQESDAERKAYLASCVEMFLHGYKSEKYKDK